MAVEIKELVIRALVDYQEEALKSNKQAESMQMELNQEAIIEACVRKILKIIAQSNKR